jgi:hypothetical protein
MGRQLITMGVGLDIMPQREGRFYLCVVFQVGMLITHGVMTSLLIVAFLVLTGDPEWDCGSREWILGSCRGSIVNTSTA